MATAMKINLPETLDSAIDTFSVAERRKRRDQKRDY